MPPQHVVIRGAFVQPLKSYNVVTIGQQCSGMLMHFASVVSNVNYKGLYLEDMNCLFHNSLRLNCLMFGGLISCDISLALLRIIPISRASLMMIFGITIQHSNLPLKCHLTS
ncbi:hypothetical protein MTR67_023199 [Solanum verrucosum]|uniref:Uncharacterized protein n=1 Tax=Solanum verrucosum TaxID=315347 RepID=A0AAF0TRZ5_SOLVR|nr:hypothetical protein MTR67_023199 [Solanum verrucosum]